MKHPSSRSLKVAAAFFAAVLLGAGGGVAAYSVAGGSGTKTVVRQVTVSDAQPAANDSALTPLQFGDSSAVQVGDAVVAIGSPLGLDETVTSGIVSALNRTITSPNNFAINDAIQTDAAINHGNSGGPLLDLQGQVIGINSQIESDSGGNDGIGFAVPSNTVKSVVSQ